MWGTGELLWEVCTSRYWLSAEVFHWCGLPSPTVLKRSRGTMVAAGAQGRCEAIPLWPRGGRFARPFCHSHVDQTRGTRERPTHACAIESRLVAGLFLGDRMIFERMAGASKLVKIGVVFAVESAAAALIAAEVRLRDTTDGRVTALCINLTALWLSSSRRAQRTGSPFGCRSLRRGRSRGV